MTMKQCDDCGTVHSAANPHCPVCAHSLLPWRPRHLVTLVLALFTIGIVIAFLAPVVH